MHRIRKRAVMRLHVRRLLATLLLVVLQAPARAIPVHAEGLQDVVAQWERRLDARIGVLLREVSTEWETGVRADERFPMSSTFKVLLCGAVLARVDAGTERLDTVVRYAADDLVTYSPVTKDHVGTGLSVGDLCKATMTLSDNTAGNLLLDRVDGPTGLTAFLRRMGDDVTRLDRWETTLNAAVPGDPRDTTTPRAILGALQQLLFGDVLSAPSRKQLAQWMIDDQVAGALIRPHVPQGWIIGDKTGAGGYGSRGIVAFLRVPDGGTYLAAIYLTESQADMELRNAVLSDIGRAMIAEIKSRE